MFTHGAFDFKHFIDMPKTCSHCGLNFIPEPGFYMGSMFISYALFAWGMLSLVGLFLLVMHLDVNLSIFLAIALAGISFTYVNRLSRTIALHMAKKYQGK